MTMTMDLFQLRAHEGQKIIGEILHTLYKVIISRYYHISLSKDGLVLANSADPDEMAHSAAFHLGLHNLQNTCLGIFSLMCSFIRLLMVIQIEIDCTPKVKCHLFVKK